MFRLLTDSFNEKATLLIESPQQTSGIHKVKYHADEDWDFQLHVERTPIDLTLNLPHYRAVYQPVDHKMSMSISNRSGPTKLKLCRNTQLLSRFYLDVYSETSDITIWIPSDFKGRISHTGKAVFSAGFVNRIMRNARINEPIIQEDLPNEDEIVVHTKGRITFRMWDLRTRAPESATRESLKRLFGCNRRVPEFIDWDFLLEDDDEEDIYE